MFAKINVANDTQSRIDEIGKALAASANHAFRLTYKTKQIPEDHDIATYELQSGYKPHAHKAVGL